MNRNNDFSKGKKLQEEDSTDHNHARKRVSETLRLFRTVSQSIMEDEGIKNPTIVATRARGILRKNDRFVNDTEKQSFGSVPGVEVGDEFICWMELNIVGLHRQLMTGIDYVNRNGKTLAVSVVSSGKDYGDEIENVDVLVYTGEGGNLKSDSNREPKDQVLRNGNLALKNSYEVKNPIRVIIKTRSKNVYVYYGLYEVEVFWDEIGPHGKKVFKFQLRRLIGQQEVSKSKSQIHRGKFSKGVCVRDISYGNESILVRVVNTVDDEKPSVFEYLPRLVYPDWFKFSPVNVDGCDCVDGCFNSEKCCCALINGGKIPFDHGAIVGRRSLVYECGPHCKCPPTCKNRVSQNGIKFPLEIFRTNTKGWGVRSPSTIPCGSFVCEYTGKLVADSGSGRRNHKDEYRFEIGNNRAKASTCVSFEDSGFTIDAANSGNVGRFINRSRSPNLLVQKVLL